MRITATSWRRKVQWLILRLLGLSLLLFAIKQPSHEGDWRVGHQQLAQIHLDGDWVHFNNLRDFRYISATEVAEDQWSQASYPLSELRRVWFGVSHFSSLGLAHTLLSFEFGEEDFVVVSIEARMQAGQSYSLLGGFMRQFSKIHVWGTEADLIGLRSHWRGERLLLYPLELDAVQRRHVLLGLIEDSQVLLQRPAFYHTLLDNCTTGLLRHDPGYRVWQGLLDYRILLPGHADAFAQARGWLDPNRSLSSWRLDAQVDASISADAPDFSRRIRERITH